MSSDSTLTIWNFYKRKQKTILDAETVLYGLTDLYGENDDLYRKNDLYGKNACIHSLAATSDNECVIFGFSDGNIRVWNLLFKELGFALQGHSDSVNSLAITRDNKYVISGSSDRTIRI